MGLPAETALSLLWLIPAAVQDWRTRQVSNALTLTGIAASLSLRLAGATRTSWPAILGLAMAALALWMIGGLGGADAKAWIAFALLDVPVIVGAALGGAVWALFAPRDAEGRLPGFPGYAAGVAVVLVVQVLQCFSAPVIP